MRTAAAVAGQATDRVAAGPWPGRAHITHGRRPGLGRDLDAHPVAPLALPGEQVF